MHLTKSEKEKMKMSLQNYDIKASSITTITHHVHIHTYQLKKPTYHDQTNRAAAQLSTTQPTHTPISTNQSQNASP